MQHDASIIKTLRDLVAIASVSSLEGALDRDNLPVAARIAEQAEALGARVELMPIAGHRPGKVNVIATWGRGEDALVLSGHTDTVPAGDHGWQSDPYALEERQGRLIGLGACDMKAFFALVFAAVEALGGKTLASRLRHPLVLVGTANEECDMAGARAMLARFSASPVRLGRYAIIGEPTGGKPVRMHKGVAFSQITLRGQSGHSSMPQVGNNALVGMTDVLLELRTVERELAEVLHDGFTPRYSTINLGSIHGGDAPNRICDRCTLQFDTRIVPNLNSETFFANLDARIGRLARARGLDLVCERSTATVPAFETASDSAIVRAVEAMTGAQAESVPFATEGPFFNQMGMETIVYGPGDISVAHQPNEYLEIAQLTPYVERLMQLIQELTFAHSQ